MMIFIVSALAFTISDQQPRYKNLKILPKDISKEKMDSIMHNFCMSLNVRCNFCHVRNEAEKKWNFANDSLAEKLIARKMMLMTMDINKKYFRDEEKDFHPSSAMVPSVTCFTCHRGAELPMTIPPPPPPRPTIPIQIQQPPKLDSSK